MCQASEIYWWNLQLGEIYRHISIKSHEHLETDKKSNIYQDLRENLQCNFQWELFFNLRSDKN